MYEIAKRPEMQSRMREEIKKVRAKVQARVETDFTAADYEEMPYTIATMKAHFFFVDVSLWAMVLTFSRKKVSGAIR